MGCYYTLCHNTYAYSLLFYKVYMKRENADSWNSGLEKEQILETYSAQLQQPETSRNSFLELIKNTEQRKYQRGPHPGHEGGGAPPASWAPWTSTDLNSNTIDFLSRRKKLERKFHRVLRYEAAAKP